MTASELLQEAVQKGLVLTLEGGSIRVRGPQADPEAAALIEEIRSRRNEVIEALKNRATGITIGDVFRIFGLGARGMLTDQEIKEALAGEPARWVRNGGEDSSSDAACRQCGGKIVERTWPDGRRDHGCYGCGRRV
jgi:hypothetical protein